MLFNSIAFLIFFPIVTILYYVLPYGWRWLHLLIASCLFYMYFVPIYILILLVTILIDYFAAIYIERAAEGRREIYLWVSIISTCIVLFIFKYYDFFISNFNELANLIGWNYSLSLLRIVLPVGLSFHTFQSLSYVIEVYRGNQKAERHFGIYSLYVMYYPQLVAGPIERPQNLLHQLRKKVNFKFTNFYRGLRYIIYGLFLKLVVADRLAIYVNAVYNNVDKHTGLTCLGATLFFGFQVYADFAGYSSIALGASRMMGVRLMTNFKRPFISDSIGEFWRRWHISLSTWLRDYLYTPLVIQLRNWGRSGIILSLLISFLIIGLWHGANWTFVVFGLWHGLALCYELVSQRSRSSLKKKLGARFYGAISILGTFIFFNLTLPFFRAGSIEEAFMILGKFLHPGRTFFTPPNPEILIYCIVAVVSVIVIDIYFEWSCNRYYFNPRLATKKWPIVILVVVILMTGVFDGSQFIYFQF